MLIEKDRLSKSPISNFTSSTKNDTNIVSRCSKLANINLRHFNMFWYEAYN